MRRRQLFALAREPKPEKAEISTSELRRMYREKFGKGCGRMARETIMEKLNVAEQEPVC